MFRAFLCGVLLLTLAAGLCSCGIKRARHYDYPAVEANWIREGMPIDYAGTKWYPTEHVENHLDREMELMGYHKDVPFYVSRRQVKPFDRIYTKFDAHKYRIFLPR